MSRYNNVYRPVIGIIKRSTEKAFLVIITDPDALTEEDATQEHWIPKSQVQSTRPMRDINGSTEFMMSEWILKEKDLLKLISTKPADNFAKNFPSIAAASHPSVPSTPPVTHWADMDDDIQF